MREETMLRKLKSGDPAGLEALMERYIPYVSTVVWNILRGAMSPEDGEEVASDVFLTAWNQAEDLRPGHVKSWLGAVARHKAKNKLREQGGTLPLEDGVLELPGPDEPGAGLEREEERRRVRQAVDSLPDRDREIFLRYYYCTQSVKEISAAMELNESTVKTRLRRGRMRLKEILTEGACLTYEA